MLSLCVVLCRLRECCLRAAVAARGDRAVCCCSCGDRAVCCCSCGDRAVYCCSCGDRAVCCCSCGDRAVCCLVLQMYYKQLSNGLVGSQAQHFATSHSYFDHLVYRVYPLLAVTPYPFSPLTRACTTILHPVYSALE